MDVLYEPLLVSVTLRSGSVAADPRTGVMLDGLLASVVRDRQKKERGILSGSLLDGGLSERNPAAVDLPLLRCVRVGAEEDWHWVSSVPRCYDDTGELVTVPEEDVRHLYSRMGEKVVENVSDRLPLNLHPSQGRYKMRRIPVVTTICSRMEWATVGDRAQVEDLLGDVFSVGGERGRGEGLTAGWEVVSVPEAAQYWGHVWEDGVPARPATSACPSEVRAVHDGSGSVVVGVRPPYWHASVQRQALAGGLFCR